MADKKLNIEFTDGYGGNYPDPKIACSQCEGMGLYPTQKAYLNTEACLSPTGRLIVIGQKEEDGTPCEEDEWVFVQCPHCNGTGKRQGEAIEKKRRRSLRMNIYENIKNSIESSK